MLRPPLMFAAAGWMASIMLTASTGEAQQLELAAAADLVAGVEGGGSGYAAGTRRTRTTLRLGGDLWIDEWPNNSLGIAAMIEIEPVATIGADLRYQRRVANDFIFHVGGLAVIAPSYMVGATFGTAYRTDVTSILEVNIGPTGNVYFVGNDLPQGQLIWQVTLGAGARIQF